MKRDHEIIGLVRKIIREQSEDDAPIPGDMSPEQEDWSSPTGRKSNAYKVAEQAAKQNPSGLLERLGTTAMETPSTGTVKDVENFLRQVIMKNSDLSMVYSTVKASGGNVYIERRKSNTKSYSEEFSFMTSNAASARYISLLMVAGGILGWVKYDPAIDTVMFGGQENTIIRVVPNSYGGKKQVVKNEPAPSENVE